MRELFKTPAFGLVWVVGFFQGVGFFLLVNVPGRFLELGLREGTIGLVYAGAAFVGLAFRPVLGRTLDVVRRRTVMRVAGLVNAVAVVGLAFTAVAGIPLLGWFVLARASQIAVVAATLTYVADILPPAQRTKGIAIFGMSSLLPIAVSNLIGDALIGLAGYRGAIVASGAMALVAAVLVWWLPALPVLRQGARRSFWAALAQPDLRMVWFITLVLAVGVETMFAFMRTFVEARPGVGSLALFFGLYGAVAVFTRLFTGALAGAGPRLTATLGSFSLGVGIVTLAFAQGPGALMVAAVFAGAAHGVVFPILSSEVVSRARPSERGSAIATFTSIFGLSTLAFVPLIGLIIDVSGYSAAFGSVGLAIILGSVAYHSLDVRRGESLASESVVED
jgi:predicted MFS family arabinose efflux permease